MRASETVHIRGIALDLDNTALDADKRVTTRTSRAVARARAQGLPVITTSARGLPSFREVAFDAPFGPLAVCANGALIVSVPGLEVVDHEAIDAGVVLSVLRELRRRIQRVSLAVESFDELVGEAFILEDVLATTIEPVEDVLASFPTPVLKVLVAAPRIHPGGLLGEVREVAAGDLEVVASEGAWVEGGPHGVSKATALDKVFRALSIEPRNVVAVGDHANDLPMLSWSGLSVAVANALPDVIRVADAVVPSNRDEGVGELLEVLADRGFRISVDELRTALPAAQPSESAADSRTETHSERQKGGGGDTGRDVAHGGI